MSIKSRVFVLVTLFLAFCNCALLAQVQGGVPRYSSVSGEIDQINLSNLNVQLTIPVLHRAGRGLGFSLDLQYNTAFYEPVGSDIWAPASPAMGWSTTGGSYPANTLTATYTGESCSGGAGSDISLWKNIAYIDGRGAQHTFNGSAVYVGAACTANPYFYGPTNVSASDGSGLVLTMSETGGTYQTTLILPSGATLHPTFIDNRTPPTDWFDWNGNYIGTPSFIPQQTTQGANGAVSWTPFTSYFTDTLGNNVITVTGTPNIYQGDIQTFPTYSYTYGTGSTALVTPTYTNFNIQTNFDCPGILEFSGGYDGYTNGVPNPMPLMTSLVLPDGRSYHFMYETGVGGNVTGRISEITLPSGGTINYAYTAVNGQTIDCSSGSPLGFTRTVDDGVGNITSSTYTLNDTTSPRTTTVKDNATGAYTVYTFYQPIENGNQYPLGTYGPEFIQASQKTYDSNGTLLKSATTQYNGLDPTSQEILYPILSRSTTTTITSSTSNISSKNNLTYNSLGLSTETDVYDFGTPGGPASNNLLSKTVTAYAVLGPIYDHPSSVTTYASDGVTKTGQTLYGYDEVSLVPTTGVPNHFAGRNLGNTTSVKKLVSGTNTWLTSREVYYDTGELYSSFDENNSSTQTPSVSYADTQCGGSLLGSTSSVVTNNGVTGSTLGTSQVWNCATANVASSVDPNGQSTSVIYNDPFGRPTSSTDKVGNTTAYTYPTSSSNTASISTSYNGGLSVTESVTAFDGLGRPILQQNWQGPGTTSYNSISTTYEHNLSTWISLPYTAGLGAYHNSGTGTTTYSDVLGRVTKVVDGGGGWISYSYSLNDVAITNGPQVPNENLKVRQLQYNPLGQVTSVCEETTGTGSAGCGQNSPATGYLTQYSYTAGSLSKVVQNAQDLAANRQTRTINYDLFGRKLSETVPETGLAQNTYDNDATGVCPGTFVGDIVKTIDNAGNVLCYTYDSLHRLTSTIVVSGPYSSGTPKEFFVYDAANMSGTAMQNVKGTLAEAYTCSGACTTKLTDLFRSTNPETVSGVKTGRSVSQQWEQMPHSSGYYLVQATSYSNGAIGTFSASLNGAAIGLPTITYGIDGMGRPTVITDTTYNNNLVTNVTYNANSQPLSVTIGNGDKDNYGYDPLTNRETSFGSTIIAPGNFTTSGSLTWNADSSLSNFMLTDSGDSSKNQNCTYARDDVGRLASVNCSGSWAQIFTYTAAGNINKLAPTNPGPGQITQTYTPTYSATTNQVSSGGASYDALGNQTLAEGQNFGWNAYSQPVSVEGVTSTYDALGRMVETNSAGVYTEFLYSPGGHKLAVERGGTLVKGIVPLIGGGAAIYGATGLSYLRHADWLGSSRFATTWGHGVYATEAYAPYGETYNEGSIHDRSFTGNDQDTASGVYDFLFRRYDPTSGRWLSPDPAKWSSVSLSHPQSFNRYAYVQNYPLSATDPDGQACVYDNGDGQLGYDNSDTATSDAGSTSDENEDSVYIPGIIQPGDVSLVSVNSIDSDDGQYFNTYEVGDRTVGIETGPADGSLISIAAQVNLNPADKALAEVGVNAAEDSLPFVIPEVAAPLLELGAAAGGTVEAIETTEAAAPEVGTKVYRVFGDGADGAVNPETGQPLGAQAIGRYWTTVNPADVADFRLEAGIYPANSGQFVVEGTLNDATGVSFTEGGAAPGPNGGGGIPELFVPYPEQQIIITNVSGVNPQF